MLLHSGNWNSKPIFGLMAYLRETNKIYPIWALKTQNLLWDEYVNNRFGLGSGISAMPSMHVASTFLFFLLGH